MSSAIHSYNRCIPPLLMSLMGINTIVNIIGLSLIIKSAVAQAQPLELSRRGTKFMIAGLSLKLITLISSYAAARFGNVDPSRIVRLRKIHVIAQTLLSYGAAGSIIATRDCRLWGQENCSEMGDLFLILWGNCFVHTLSALLHTQCFVPKINDSSQPLLNPTA